MDRYKLLLAALLVTTAVAIAAAATTPEDSASPVDAKAAFAQLKQLEGVWEAPANDLVLTHYCIANNQPVLRAEQFDPATREIQFEFMRAGTLPSPANGHMDRAKYRIVNAAHFVPEWEFFENGAKQMTETETFTRVK